MKRTASFAALVFLNTLFLTSCAKNIDNKDAVQEGVRKGVAQRGIDVNQMDVNVTSVNFHGKTADATVAFAAKGSPASTGVSVNYQLERVKDEWVVKSRAPMSGVGHTGATGGAGALPPGHPSMESPGR